MLNKTCKDQVAFSLSELLLALSLLASISLIAIPAINNTIQSMRMRSNLNGLIHSFHQARQSALTSGQHTVVCRSRTGKQCAENGNWADGWLIFTNLDQDEPPYADPEEPILAMQSALPQLHISANRRAFTFRPFGLRSTNGTLIWCDQRGAEQAWAIIMSYTGKPRVSKSDASGKALECTN